MSEVFMDNDENAKCECESCGWEGLAKSLEPIADFEMRVSAGEICPAGECPECGALAFIVELKDEKK